MTEAIASVHQAQPDPDVRPASDVMARRIDRIIAGLIVAAALARIVFLMTADPVDLTHRSTDDSYYYYNVARHIVAGHGITFDGINETNGFHPLWMLLLLPVFWLFSDPVVALRAVFAMVTVICAASFWVGYRCISHWAGRLAAVFGLCVMLAPFFLNPMINGLETGLLILSLWLLIYAEQRYALLSSDTSVGANALLGALLALVFLSRLDGVFVVLMTFLVIIIGGLLRKSGDRLSILARKLVQVGIVALVLVLPFLVWNLTRTGHLVPISGALKSSFPQVSFSSLRLGHLSTKLGLMQIGISIVCLVLCHTLKANQQAECVAKRSVPIILWVLLVAGIAHFANSMLFMNWAVHWWHFASYVPMTVALLALLFGAVFRSIRTQRTVAPVVLVATVAAVVVTFVWDARARGDHHRPWYEAALWVNKNLPESAVLGMTDCGLFGYFCERPVVNLDGVINGYAYQEALRDNRLSEYLRDCRISHIADYEVKYRAGRYRIRLPARLYRKPGGAIFATPGAESYASTAYHHAMADGDGVHFAIWPLDQLEVIDDYGADIGR